MLRKDNEVKGKIDYKILIIIILIIVLAIMCYFYFKEDSIQFDQSKLTNNTGISSINDKTANTTIVNTTSEVSSGLTEKLELHATYYLEESYVEVNQSVKAGENILKYTNGTYLTAPYDCIITELNIPNNEEKCTSEHYIQISSNNTLKVQFKVDETEINNISLGQKANVQISAYENKVLEGIVTNISSTASNGKFTVTVQFENDGKVMIGMTAVITIYEIL